MKRILIAGAVVMLSLGAAGSALANSAVELITGSSPSTTDIVYYDGTTLACSIGGTVLADCSAFGVTASKTANSLTVTATSLGGWNVSGDTGITKAPNCDATHVCEDQTDINAVNIGGTADLTAFFAASGFTTPGPLDFALSASSTDGTVLGKASAYTGGLGLSDTAVPTGALITGLFSTLSLSNPGFVSSTGAAAPGGTYNLATGFNFTAA